MPSEKHVCLEDQHLSQGDPSLFQDTNIKSPQRPITRALKKLIDYKNAATMAISMLHQNDDFLTDPYTFTKNYTEFCCDKCYNAFLSMKFCSANKQSMDLRNLIKNKPKINQPDEDFICALFNLIKNNKYCKNDAKKPLKDADQLTIGAIKEALRGKLISIASRLFNSQHSKLEDLSEEDQNLWKKFDNSDIYVFIIGEKDTLPEFQYNWIEPCQLAVHLPSGVLLASQHDLQPPPAQQKPLVQPPLIAQQHHQLCLSHREGINQINNILLKNSNR
jgi:hypothetical protein